MAQSSFNPPRTSTPHKKHKHTLLSLQGNGPLSISALERKRQREWEQANQHTPKKLKANHDDITKDNAPVLTPAKSSEKHKSKRESKSQSLLEQRRGLPIWSAKNSLIREIGENEVVVILGETGSGKTTQIPQFILESDIASGGLIAITQPRKVAATSLANRVSAEQSTSLGTTVGYAVRFDEKTSPETKIKYMTDGMLGRELLNDPLLGRYSVIIVDEAHERTLRTDMLLTSLKSILRTRNGSGSREEKPGGRKEKGKGKATDVDQPPPLKVIIMSATLDAERFSDFFGGAKILYVKGRQHPVRVLHVAEPQKDYVESALQTFFQIHTDQPPGDVLIFLPGQEDIENLTNMINELGGKINPELMQVMTCPMYAALPPSQQTKVFGRPPPNTRKCVLATNIAETSITIPGVKYVIDTGLCKEKRYFVRGKGNGVDALMTQPISKSSALQRTGRAGREGEGWCFRLYTESAFQSFRESAVPEIQRCNLTLAVLQMKCLGQNPETADFMDAPSQDTESSKYHSTNQVTSLLALLSASGKTFFDPSDSNQREAASEARLKFRHRSGDHMTILNALRAYEELSGQLDDTSSKSKGEGGIGRKGVREWCKEHFLNERTLKEALEIRRQLRQCCEKQKMDWKARGNIQEGEEGEEEGVLKSMLAGLWQNTALITPDGTYRQVIGQQPVKIHPSSTLFGKKCPAIMYDELVYTTNTYAMGVSSIPQAWLAEIPFFAQQRAALGNSGRSTLS
ncbi:putative ATP-dependent RNA helicase dhr2 [Tulasnella sp. 418]|nr:putative ATP-dependent RNA helicase dhr2 [Tulasnella sp. 418]